MNYMKLESLDDCKLVIGNYPPFKYNAIGGGGKARLNRSDKQEVFDVEFSKDDFYIPELNYKTTRILGVPIPPGIKIRMELDQLKGKYNSSTEEMVLAFESRFILSLWQIFTAPDIIIKTDLTTNRVTSKLHDVTGKISTDKKETVLVGVAIVEPTGNKYLDLFLGLPSEALAVLNCKLIK